ncbi:MAG: cellulase family glycosylhydrolase [Oscillospiraceae bacterium]
MEKITVRGNCFVDEYGRERIFNGINICDKDDFNICKYTLNEFRNKKIYTKIKNSGFNLIRLGFTWGAMEPEPMKYNEKLLDDICKILDECAKYDIYIYLDMHQDLYSGMSGAGDGAPEWATLTDGYEFKKPIAVWAEGYFWGKAVARSFDNFWNNKEHNGIGLMDYYEKLWIHIADRVKDKPALFGFDLMNEPYPGTVGQEAFRKVIGNAIKVTLTDKRLKKGKLIRDILKPEGIDKVLKQYNGEILRDVTSAGDAIIKRFDEDKYIPFLNKMTSGIRSVTDNGIITLDCCYFSNISIPSGSTPITVDGNREENQCYSPHSYDLTVDTPSYKYADFSRVKVMFDEHNKTGERLAMPVLVGEWGGASEGYTWLPHINELLEYFDDHKWSNTYWAFTIKSFDDPVMLSLKRPYPRAVTGEIIKYNHNRDENTFTMEYKQEGSFDVPTVVYVPRIPYKVETNGEYKIEKLENTSSANVLIFTKEGTNTVKISF